MKQIKILSFSINRLILETVVELQIIQGEGAIREVVNQLIVTLTDKSYEHIADPVLLTDIETLLTAQGLI